MARVTHPNVIEVLGAGIHDSMAYIAMERLDGTDLRRWLAARPRTRDEILDVFEQAGRGLAAAHASGLIHRDFKPENVVITDDGRVKVLDFGLAVASASPSKDMDAEATHSATSKVGGTRAYMPEEQLRGMTVDPRSDQYAFCVALLEALDSAPTQPGARVIPSRLRRAIERGKARRIEERYASMEAMLAALAAARRSTRWRWGLLAGGSLVAIVGALGSGEHEPTICRDVDVEIEEAWNATERQRIAALAADSGAPLLVPKLDGYAQRWTDALGSACRSRRASPRGAGIYEETWRCLEQARTSLGLLASSIEDIEAAGRAVDAVERLPSVERCLRAPAKAPSTPSDPKVAAELEAIREQALLVRTLDELGRFEAAFEIGQRALARARRLGTPSATADVLGSVAHVEAALGRAKDALEHTTEAYFLAREAGDDEAAAWLATELGTLAYEVSADPTASEQWFSSAQALLDRLDRPAGRVARLEQFRGNIASRRGLERDALQHYAIALDLLQSTEATAPTTLASLLISMGSSNESIGEFEVAEQQLERAYGLYVRHRGVAHPHTATPVMNLGVLETNRGRHGAAMVWFTTAIATVRTTMGDDHHDLLLPWTGLSRAVVGLGNPDAARTFAAEALRIAETAHGPSHPRTAQPLASLADIEDKRGDLESALRLYDRARDNVALARGHHDATVARIENNMGWVLRRLGRFDEALPLYEHAVEVMTDAVGPQSPKITAMLLGLGACRVEVGEFEAARDPLKGAIDLFDRSGLPIRFLGDALGYLARAELHAGAPGRATSSLLAALSIHAASGRQDAFEETRHLLLATAMP